MNNVKNLTVARALAIGVAAALVFVVMAGTGAAVTGLVGEWHFDGNAQDSSGNGNHGTIYGATFTEGIIGNALSFDGVSNYFTAPITASFNSVKTQGTIVAWINYKDNYLIYEPGGSCTYGSRALMLWRFGTYNIKSQANIDCAGRILSDWRIGSQIGSGISQSLKSGQWYHIALVYDSNAVILYINGQKVKSSSLTGELGDADDKFWIGRNGNAAQPMYFNGLIDEVRIYNRALTDSEIQAEYNALTPAPTTPAPTTPAPTTPLPTTPIPTTPVPTTPTTAGYLSVSSSPSGASIFLDGSPRGKTPKDLTDVSTGSHYIELKLDDYKPWSDTIDVKAGSTSYVSVPLAPLSTATATTTPTYTATPTPPPSKPSVSLHGDKTDVVLGEDIILKLSALNLITKPKMHVQVIIIPPSGMSVTSSEFSKVMAGQFAANYELEPGDGKDIEVRIKSNQAGQFNVDGRVVYYFGDDKDTGGDSSLSLPIRVREVASQTPAANPVQNSTPGFESALGIIGILFTALLKRRTQMK